MFKQSVTACYENTVTKIIVITLKTEWIYGTSFADQQELPRDLFVYIELFKNQGSPWHSTPGSLTSAKIMQKLHLQQSLAS